MQYAHDAARRQLRPTGAERPGLTKQKHGRRHLARRRIAARERQPPLDRDAMNERVVLAVVSSLVQTTYALRAAGPRAAGRALSWHYFA